MNRIGENEAVCRSVEELRNALRRPREGRHADVIAILPLCDVSTGIVLAQVQIAAKSNEIPAFTPLLRLVAAVLGSLRDVLVVADALHAQTGHAELLAAAGGHLMTAVKANQPTLFAQLKALPWAEVPVGSQTRETGHGRKETRTVKVLTVSTPGGLGFPYARQAVRITRTATGSSPRSSTGAASAASTPSPNCSTSAATLSGTPSTTSYPSSMTAASPSPPQNIGTPPP